jgi:hypothetical protein
VRQREIGEAEHRLLSQLAGRISNRLEATFIVDRPGEGTAVGVQLSERGRSTAMELPVALIERAHEEPAAREELRVRIKSTRDRMLFRAPPRPLPKKIASAADPAFFSRGGFGGRPGGGGGRGRR